jgi:hypothetical protein
MKKGFLLASIIVLMSSCVTVHLPKPYTKIRMVDYSWLTEQGIFVTESNSVSFEYETVGSVHIEASSGFEPQNKDKHVTEIDRGDGIYTTYLVDGWSKSKWDYIPVSLENMFGELAYTLKENGADGIVNFKISYDHIGQRDIAHITGMAIKRK